MRVRFTANAGVFVELSGVTVLMDGLHRGRSPFSGVPASLAETIIRGDGMFRQINFMIVTHMHPDHYNEELTGRLLAHHPETLLIAPGPVPDARNCISTRGETGTAVYDRCRVDWVRLRHEGTEYQYVPNYGYRVTSGSESFLVLGDAAADSSRFGLDVLTQKDPVSAAFLNFPLVTLRKGREALRDLRADHAFVFHLPFQQEDQEGYTRSAMRGAQIMSRESGIPVTLMTETDQVFGTSSV